MKNILIAIIGTIGSMIIVFFIYQYRDFAIKNIEHKNNINILDTRIKGIDSLQIEKNIATQLRITKMIDNNSIEHKEIKNEIVVIKEDISEIKGMLHILISDRNTADVH